MQNLLTHQLFFFFIFFFGKTMLSVCIWDLIVAMTAYIQCICRC